MSTEIFNDPIGVSIMVATTKREVDEGINKFLSNGNNKRKVIGLDTEWISLQRSSYIAILQLCDGDSCLIVRCRDLIPIPASLFNFLRLPEYKFVAIGMKENVVRLDKDYGMTVRNAVDLRSLAADVRNQPSLAACGLDDLLALEVSWLELRKPMSAVFGDWSDLKLHHKDRVKHAMLNVYAYFHIGSKLFARMLSC